MLVGSFEWALINLKQGEIVSRDGWNGVQQGKIMYLSLQKPDANSKMTVPYVYLTVTDSIGENRIPWVVSQKDLMAEDWSITK